MYKCICELAIVVSSACVTSCAHKSVTNHLGNSEGWERRACVPAIPIPQSDSYAMPLLAHVELKLADHIWYYLARGLRQDFHCSSLDLNVLLSQCYILLCASK